MKYFVQNIPYLVSETDSDTNYGCIRLSSDLRNLPGRMLNIDTRGWKYYKVNSVAYPIYDTVKNRFIEKETWYDIESDRTPLKFFPINIPLLSDCIFVCDNTGDPTYDTVFYLNITLSNSMEVRNNYKQTIQLTTPAGFNDAYWIFCNISNYSNLFESIITGPTVDYYYGSISFNGSQINHNNAIRMSSDNANFLRIINRKDAGEMLSFFRDDSVSASYDVRNINCDVGSVIGNGAPNTGVRINIYE